MKMNKNCWLYLSFLFCLVTIQAQDTIPTPASTKSKPTRTIVLAKDVNLQKNTVQVIDTTKVISTIGELKTSTFTKTSVKDSVMYVAKDHPKMSQLDAIWKQELYNSSLFDSIYKSVTELEYEPVEFVDLPTDTLKARLKELNARTPFNVEYNASLESVIKNYLKNRHEHLERLMALSEFYFPLFEQELDNQNIPLEIKYLAIVESALKPRAKSRVGATGLWQFMFGTGKMFGLEVSSYVDERMDPIMATQAACKYLASLYRVFGDWDLALASYNSGPGNVTKAIRRSGGYTNYWNIRHNLPRETAGYLPAFLATMYIFEYAEEHGFKPKRPEFAYFETDTIKVKQMITLDQVSEYMDINIEELQFLNPSYKLDIIPHIKDENYVLRLPLDQVGKFVSNEEQIYALAQAEFDKREKPLPKFYEANDKIRYRVRSGDFLGKIARRYGVRVSQIKRWNGLRSNNLRIGQRLTIYPRRPVVDRPQKKKSTTKAVASTTPGSSEVYTVKSGDTLWSISQKFKGVSIENLRSWNDISGSGIKPGMKLKLSKS
ncbi:LysM peptidoglycan-binding domain-containing protein [Aquimarina sp. 2201CG14-23]|uniref:LysM peptidoglycan-binding domain-containing protein n=2 Tax=Aquimarina mycalae TaxID=3040073 RepID=UPI0024782688|nr:LysM peptidoglycan-binding domain-containing protein [Aquimarina sp. 2201CG14-23]MDH7446338.1 LysM peptidoglycan-binding domain-containing protein [Aquimarina sp. 2201CG14-23]